VSQLTEIDAEGQLSALVRTRATGSSDQLLAALQQSRMLIAWHTPPGDGRQSDHSAADDRKH